MMLNEKLYDLFEEAKQVKNNTLCVGIGYTVVTISDGGMGLSYTCFKSKSSCSMNQAYMDYE
jgi:hypothetical protein